MLSVGAPACSSTGSTTSVKAPARPHVRSTSTTEPAGPPWSIRTATFDFVDASRPSPARGTVPPRAGRSLHTTLRWPVSRTGVVAPGRLPLVVFGHGYRVSAATYFALLDGLARSGIVVAAPEFPGESSALPGSEVESDLVNEPCDMEFVAASLEGNPPAGLRVALHDAPLIVAGHSDGATAAASAAYSSSCSSIPIRGTVALSVNDVPMTGAYRFGTPPALLAITGSADEVNPVSHTVALYEHAPKPAWLVTIAGGSHLGTFTTDPDLARIEAIIADFVVLVSAKDPNASARLDAAAGGRIAIQSR
jgi:hypothetical protein